MKTEKNIIRPLYIIIFWTAIALLFGGQNYIIYSLKGMSCSLLGTMLEHIPTFAIWALFTPFIQIVLLRYPIMNSKSLGRDLIIHFALATLLGLISLIVIGMGRWMVYGLGRVTLIDYIKEFSVVWFFYQYVMYSAMILFLLAINYYKKFRDKEAQAVSLQKLLVESQLNSLKMQLQPHFLFNTLNTISMLVRMDKKESANKVISKLGDMLRNVLQSKDGQMTSLREELALIEKYLSIEVIRFEDRLTYKFNSEENTMDEMVPDMVLQPLVENCIKHGMKNINKPMHITIDSKIKNDRLIIQVSDNGQGFNTKNESFINEGIGLKNTIERCEKIYNKNCVEIESELGTGTNITLDLPVV